MRTAGSPEKHWSTVWWWLGALTMALGLVGSAHAGPIAFNTWYEFGFTDAGIAATGCDPADAAGPFCIASSGTPTTFLDAPPWTFLAMAGTTLTVVDAFTVGDRFEVFDFGAPVGTTSLPIGTGDCGDDPVPCLADPSVSHGIFGLAAGPHSISIVPLSSLDGGGSGYLQVAAVGVPEPGSIVLLSESLIVLALVGAWLSSKAQIRRP